MATVCGGAPLSNLASTIDAETRRLFGFGLHDLSPDERRVIESLMRRALVARPPAADLEGSDTAGGRLADRVAAIGGSWAFIGAFAAVLVLWIVGNVILKPLHLSFDPYPFIFLNLVLSTLAAIQAPIIMMSQNRQAAKDRLTAEHDYAVNLRAELEIMRVIDKLDALRSDELMVLCREHATRLEALQDEVARLRAGR